MTENSSHNSCRTQNIKLPTTENEVDELADKFLKYMDCSNV